MTLLIIYVLHSPLASVSILLIYAYNYNQMLTIVVFRIPHFCRSDVPVDKTVLEMI